MRLLDRYLLRELLVPLGYCLGAFVLCWIAFDMFDELGDLLQYKLRAGDIVKYYLVRAPEFVALVLPFALLLALLYTLTNHARHHEVTAIRAAGVSLWRLALPYFVVGFLASILLFLLNEYFVPDAADAAERIKNSRLDRRNLFMERHLVRNQGFINARDNRRWLIGVFDERTGELQKLQVDWRDTSGTLHWIRAERAIHTNGAWMLFNAEEYYETNSTLVPGRYEEVMVADHFSETPDEIRSEFKISKRMSLRKKNKADLPISEILDYLRLHPNLSATDRSWIYTKLHGRLAAPWTCLIVVLIALPFGAASGRRNVFVGVASSIFICFAYYVLLQLGLALGAGGWLPPWLGAWATNLIFAAAGGWMTATVR